MDNFDSQKSTSRNRIRVRNALIEEIDNRNNLVTISYGVPGNYSMIFMEVVTLIVSRDTTIRDQFGQRIPMRDLRVGMRIDAEFSTAMTRSIPPQTRAFRIAVRSEAASTEVTIGTVMEVDTRNNFLYTGSPRDSSSQMRFVITDATTILNKRGNRISLRDLRRGETVRVEHANFQTPSIPPQTTAFQVRVI